MTFDKLFAPLNSDEIEWKIQAVVTSKDKPPKTLVVPYITNRCIIHRLNFYAGINNWSNKLIPVTMDKQSGFICELSIRFEDGWITRQDTAPLTDIEPLKGGASDAMKRCAVQFGIGIELYDYPKIYIEGSIKYIPDWAQTLLGMKVGEFLAGTLNRAAYILKESDFNKATQRQAYERPQQAAQPQPQPTKRQTAENMKKQQEDAEENADFVFDRIDSTQRDIDRCTDAESFDHVEDNTYSDDRLPLNERVALIKASLTRRGGMVTKVEEAIWVRKRIGKWLKAGVLTEPESKAVFNDLRLTAEENGMYYAEDGKFYYQSELEAAA